jgi:hypothetical protein
MDDTAGSAPDRRSPGAEIREDLVAAIAGASCLISTGAPADAACAQTLLLQARERCATLREIVRHG